MPTCSTKGTGAARRAKPAPGVPIVADPVMIAKGGASLLADAAIDALKSRLLPVASLIIPNIPEAEVLSGLHVENLEDMAAAA